MFRDMADFREFIDNLLLKWRYPFKKSTGSKFNNNNNNKKLFRLENNEVQKRTDNFFCKFV